MSESTVTVSLRRGAVFLSAELPVDTSDQAWSLLRQVSQAIDALNAALVDDLTLTNGRP